jgi:hypothetical protein
MHFTLTEVHKSTKARARKEVQKFTHEEKGKVKIKIDQTIHSRSNASTITAALG